MSNTPLIKQKLAEIADLLDDTASSSPPSPIKSAADKAVSSADVKALLVDILRSHGRDKAQKLLSEFNVARVSDLDEKHFDAFYARALQVLEGA